MQKELLDKPVICAYDIRAIQKYIFSNTVNADILGAGNMLLDIEENALAYAMHGKEGTESRIFAIRFAPCSYKSGTACPTRYWA